LIEQNYEEGEGTGANYEEEALISGLIKRYDW
jgi:hypothetical protein